jgi:hypothetical protein
MASIAIILTSRGKPNANLANTQIEQQLTERRNNVTTVLPPVENKNVNPSENNHS